MTETPQENQEEHRESGTPTATAPSEPVTLPESATTENARSAEGVLPQRAKPLLDKDGRPVGFERK